MTKRTKSATFRGKVYKLLPSIPVADVEEHKNSGSSKQLMAICYQTEDKRLIAFDTEVALRYSERDRLDTVIHEALHACFPDMREEAITQSARDIARLLDRLGYRTEKLLKEVL